MAYDEHDDEADLDESEEIDDDDLDVGGDETDTLPCPECGEAVYEQAERCPYCGSYITPGGVAPRNSWWILITAIVCIVIVVLAWVMRGRGA